DRDAYLTIDREGRSFPLLPAHRVKLREGLERWEVKRRAEGITDYLGLATALYKYIDQIKPRYRCALVDESQDFGNTEFAIIRRLVAPQENDIFLCGDAAQKVSSKYQLLSKAGIELPGARSKKILQNYRNSREILQLASHVLNENLTEEMIAGEDFEILDPEYANFSGPTPVLLSAKSLSQEISHALAYLRQELKPQQKGVIAICGYSAFEIERFGQKHGISVLDGSI